MPKPRIDKSGRRARQKREQERKKMQSPGRAVILRRLKRNRPIKTAVRPDQAKILQFALDHRISMKEAKIRLGLKREK